MNNPFKGSLSITPQRSDSPKVNRIKRMFQSESYLIQEQQNVKLMADTLETQEQDIKRLDSIDSDTPEDANLNSRISDESNNKEEVLEVKWVGDNKEGKVNMIEVEESKNPQPINELCNNEAGGKIGEKELIDHNSEYSTATNNIHEIDIEDNNNQIPNVKDTREVNKQIDSNKNEESINSVNDKVLKTKKEAYEKYCITSASEEEVKDDQRPSLVMFVPKTSSTIIPTHLLSKVYEESLVLSIPEEGVPFKSINTKPYKSKGLDNERLTELNKIEELNNNEEVDVKSEVLSISEVIPLTPPKSSPSIRKPGFSPHQKKKLFEEFFVIGEMTTTIDNLNAKQVLEPKVLFQYPNFPETHGWYNSL